MKKKYIYLVFSLALGFFTPMVSPVLAQSASTEIEPSANRKATQAEWDAAKSGINFSDLKKDKTKKPEKKTTLNLNPPSIGFLQSLGAVGQVVLIGLVILLVAGLFYSLIGQGLFLKNKRVDAQAAAFDIHDIENNLHETDLERYLRQAIESGDYRMAIRLYYLNILKSYSLKEAIDWKKDKTNTEYLNEIKRAALPSYPEFRTVTLVFERVWYGDTAINADDYTAIQPRFEALLKAI